MRRNSHLNYRDSGTLGFVGFGGHRQEISGPKLNLGIGIERPGNHQLLLNFCFGYVSGFPVSAILYYLLTRCTTVSMMHWAWKRERAEYERIANGQLWPRCSSECPKCRRATQGVQKSGLDPKPWVAWGGWGQRYATSSDPRDVFSPESQYEQDRFKYPIKVSNKVEQ